MNYTVIHVLFFLFIAIIFILLFYCFSRIRFMERKLVNVNYEDIQVLTEHLKDMLIESERVAEKIEFEIKEKEDMLADLSEVLELKLIRMEDLLNNSFEENNIKNTVREMSKQKLGVVDIAKRLGISSAEVELMLKFNREDI